MTNEISQYSAWFSIGETLVDESKQDITAEQAVEKIREIMRSMQKPQEVVRCKDCRFVGTDATCCLVCNRNGMGLRPFHVYHDDFCSYAERREDAEIY